MPTSIAYLLACLVATGAATAAAGEILLPLASGGHVGLSTRGPSAFRVRFVQLDEVPLDAPPVKPDALDAPFTEVDSKQGRGIQAAFGSVVVSKESSLLLSDASGAIITRSGPISANSTLTFETKSMRLYGGGSGMEDGLQLSSQASLATVANLKTYVPYYYSPGDGYAAFGMSGSTGPGPSNGGPSKSEPTAHMFALYKAGGGNITWWYRGAFELYLMPASTLEKGTQAYYSLIGAPRMLPLYAFGFIASRWGWKDEADIVSVLSTFRKDSYPIDAFIVDFEFFTTFNDYELASSGSSRYEDFGFSNVTFPAPKKQLATYEDTYHVRMGGIRKPRLGNDGLLRFARGAGYTVDLTKVNGKESILQRWLNFSQPAMREWYAASMEPYLNAGVDFWWNDEGEADYYTYYWWNTAERDLLQRKDPSKRFFSLNRAFSPGMARLGAAVWTGDNAHFWEHLERTPAMMLKQAMAGAPYGACDIGGFYPNIREFPDLLVRWYQVGTFMPIMRVHSANFVKPRFPWLWGDRPAALMRRALELRYRLVPYHYSLAHAMYATRKLWTRPMAMAFPEDSAAAEISRQWMDGELLVAPVLKQNSQREVYLPEGRWYALNSTTTLQGPTHLGGRVDLGEVPVFVRHGTVLPLAPVVQHTGALPGGPLEVQVYAGADGSFELVEDDGATTAYEAGTVRKTHLKWNDRLRTLTWTVTGGKPGPQAFEMLSLTLFEPAGVQSSATSSLAEGGSIALPAASNLRMAFLAPSGDSTFQSPAKPHVQ